MKKDKLILRAELQESFNAETIANINIAIRISKCIRFLYKESTIFVCSMLPMLICTAYLLINSVNHAEIITLVLLLVHYPFYRFIVKGMIFKGAKDTYDEFDYTIEVIEEIKADRKS